MTNDLKITCPKCKETFDAADAFNAHYKNTQIESEKRIGDIFPQDLLEHKDDRLIDE